MKTSYEQHLENQKNFREIMQLTAHLDEKESRDLIHLIKNNSRLRFLEQNVTKSQFKKELAALVEKENFAQKNRVILDK